MMVHHHTMSSCSNITSHTIQKNKHEYWCLLALCSEIFLTNDKENGYNFGSNTNNASSEFQQLIDLLIEKKATINSADTFPLLVNFEQVVNSEIENCGETNNDERINELVELLTTFNATIHQNLLKVKDDSFNKVLAVLQDISNSITRAKVLAYKIDEMKLHEQPVTHNLNLIIRDHETVKMGCIVTCCDKVDSFSLSCLCMSSEVHNLPSMSSDYDFVGNVIMLTDKKWTQMRSSWKIIMPFKSTKDPSFEVIVFCLVDGQWTELDTTEYRQDSTHQAVKTYIESPTLPLTLAVIRRSKKEHFKITKSGYNHFSQLFPQLSVSTPPNVIKLGLVEYHLQARMVDHKFVFNRHVKTIERLLSWSPIVNLCAMTPPEDGLQHFDQSEQRIVVSVPLASSSKFADICSGVDKTNDAPARLIHEEEKVMEKKALTGFQKLFKPLHFMSDIKQEEIYGCLWDDDSEKWKIWSDIELEEISEELVRVKLNNTASHKFVLLRTGVNVSNAQILSFMNVLELACSQRPVTVVYGCDPKTDPMKAAVIVCPDFASEDNITRLTKMGYTSSIPFPYITVREREQLYLTLRGNLTAINSTSNSPEFSVQYHSYIPIITELVLSVVDPSDQKKRPTYYGFLQISANRLIGKVMERKILTEIQIEKVKDKNTVTNPIPMTNFAFNTLDGLDNNFLRKLAVAVSPKWELVATHLGVTGSRQQTINRQLTDKINNVEMAYQTILGWIKSTKVNANRTLLLQNALIETGFSHLIDNMGNFNLPSDSKAPLVEKVSYGRNKRKI